MKTLTVKLDDALFAKVVAVAKRRGTTQSAVVRAAIIAGLEQRMERASSALHFSKDLAGCVTASADLSTNKAHMRGFGR